MQFGFEKSSAQRAPDVQREDAQKMSAGEAIAYQQYATEKQGIPFGEQADFQSYAEAQKMIEEIRTRGLDLEEVDFSVLDLRDALQREDLESKLESAVARLSMKNEKLGVMERINAAMGKMGIGKIAILLSLFSTLSAEAAQAGQYGRSSASFTGSETRMVTGRQERMKTVEMDGAKIAFQYDAFGKIEGFKMETKRTLSFEQIKKVQFVTKYMLVDGYATVLLGPKENGRRGMSFYDNERVLKMQCANIIEYIGIYSILQKKGMHQEADYIRTSLRTYMDQKESDLGGEVFNRKFISDLLDAK